MDRLGGLIKVHHDLGARAKKRADTEARVEARRIARELTGVLRTAFPVSSNVRTCLASARRANPSPATEAQWAVYLDALAEISGPVRRQIAGVGGFDVGDIDRASTLAEAFRAANEDEEPPKPRTDWDLRDRYVQLLSKRVALLRGSAKYLFRNHPSLLRDTCSAHERGRKRENRKAKIVAKPSVPKRPLLSLVRSRARRRR